MMNRWEEEAKGGPSAEMVNNLPKEFHEATPLLFGGLGDEDTLLQEGQHPPLNLSFTPPQELVNSIAAAMYSTENTKKLAPPVTPKNIQKEKIKATNFQISDITIGEWTHKSVYPDDLKAKFYFAKKKLMWEILDEDSRLKRKIEFHWSDVLSFKATIDRQEATGTLEVELGKCPTFYMEINQQPWKHTQWKQLDYDFTLNQSASKYRRHTVHCPSRDLKNNLDKLLSSDIVWTKLVKVKFPTLPQSLYFDDGNSNNNDNINLSPYGHNQTLGFNGNKDLGHHYPQGLGYVPEENINFNMATGFCANNQMNPIFQDNHQTETMSQLPGMQVTHPSAQLINNLMIQDERQTSNTGELLGTQASVQEPQPILMICPNPNDLAVPEIGPYLQGILAEEDAIQNMKCKLQFQTTGKCVCNQCFNNSTGSLPPPDL